MAARVLTGSKQEIAQQLVGMEGEVREVIVFIEEPAGAAAPAGSASDGGRAADVFAEMEAYTVRVSDVDDSRGAAYSCLEGE